MEGRFVGVRGLSEKWLSNFAWMICSPFLLGAIYSGASEFLTVVVQMRLF